MPESDLRIEVQVTRDDLRAAFKQFERDMKRTIWLTMSGYTLICLLIVWLSGVLSH